MFAGERTQIRSVRGKDVTILYPLPRHTEIHQLIDSENELRSKTDALPIPHYVPGVTVLRLDKDGTLYAKIDGTEPGKTTVTYFMSEANEPLTQIRKQFLRSSNRQLLVPNLRLRELHKWKSQAAALEMFTVRKPID